MSAFEPRAPVGPRGAALAATCGLLTIVACGHAGPGSSGAPDAPPAAARDALLDPAGCAPCHADHYADWSQSVHAYASQDPVFLAMNARGQRETGGALGSFCVNCHAPMAVRDGWTSDGENLPSLPAKVQGVTCYFCHTATAVGQADGDMLTIAGDTVMRAEYADPAPGAPHGSAYSALHDGRQAQSAAMCGSCHDVVAPPAGTLIERTYYEWSHSVFSGASGSTCNQCHMTPGPEPVAIAAGGPPRTRHAHDFPAVDTRLGEAPADGGTANDQQAVLAALGAGALEGALCVTQAGGVRVILDPVGVGHQWPSGAAQNRRAWVEVVAYGADAAVAYASGVVPDGGSVAAVGASDPDLWLLRECLFDAQGQAVNMLWQASSAQGNELPALQTFNPGDPRFYQTHIVQLFPRDSQPLVAMPSRVTLRVRLQPIGMDVLNDLVASGDLDPALARAMPTFDVPLAGPGAPAVLEWTARAAAPAFVDPFDRTPATCVSNPGFNTSAQLTLAPASPACAP